VGAHKLVIKSEWVFVVFLSLFYPLSGIMLLAGHIDGDDDSAFWGITNFDFNSVTCQASLTGQSCELNLLRLTNVQ